MSNNTEMEENGRGGWVLVAGSYESAGQDGLDDDDAATTATIGQAPAGQTPATRVILLGVAQDAGVPQCGCCCRHCSAVLEGALPPQRPVSLGILQGTDAWLVDATPDIKWQLYELKKACPEYRLRGVFLTHLHMGHYAGLLNFATEVMSTKRLPVYATAAACRFLRSNEPWCRLAMVDNNIELCEIEPEAEVSLGGGLSLRPTLVPHRGEYSDTVAYFLTGTGGRRMFYCPDIDGWGQWRRRLADVCGAVDIQLVDATFFSADELPGRDMRKVPHPLITDTAERLPEEAQRRKTVLIHLNHSNPVFLEGSDERQWCMSKGFQIARQGMAWDL